MKAIQSRRRFLATLSSAGAAGLIGSSDSLAQGLAQELSQESPPETTTIRLTKIPGICIAPQYVAGELLKSEGFTDVQYVDVANTDIYPAFASNTVDISMAFVAPFIVQLDANVPIVLLGGVHVGCFELFGQEGVKTVRDLKGKVVAVPSLGSSHHVFVASMAAHVGLDPNKDINFVTHPVSESARLLTEGKVDALMGFPPVPQELREKKIGHVIVNSGLDRPWSQYFCCVVAAHQEFARKRPVATKRALRAFLKAAHFCSSEPERAARIVADRGYRYDYALQTMNEIRYASWRDYDPEDAVRFYALRLREAGMIKSTPNRLIAQGTDWRFFNELKRELKG
ncbi:MAG: NitT/TauT family transport system substrate-binding protein [Alphaproteobacteria bacterium]|jgi:NitT/TauT family transport system substrate-binding protein|nr:NitT/TauT family transport system substrate-binding protein [Alphaproteobacteria bacterium]